jgi:hypoxanthine phosphoribosyltransferase
MLDDIEEIMLDQTTIEKKVSELGTTITRDYYGTDLMLVGALNGAAFFLVDLARKINLPLTLEFMAVSSYGASTTSSGIVKIIKDLDTSIEGRNVLIVEDIIDSGLTLSYLADHLRNRNPASLKICALLNKPSRRTSPIQVDYIGFDIPDKFVVGYGLDFAGKYRNLPFVGVLRPEKYT